MGSLDTHGGAAFTFWHPKLVTLHGPIQPAALTADGIRARHEAAEPAEPARGGDS